MYLIKRFLNQFKYQIKNTKPTVSADAFNIFPLNVLSESSSSNLYNENKENKTISINIKFTNICILDTYLIGVNLIA
tara:strand:+ start:197 stop:427 length:231 start_codon:yes stop_codon:yes gene_type:complete